MATTNSITTTYAGEFQGKYISTALFSGVTIANDGIEVKSNIKYKEVIKKLVSGSLLANATCDFTASSSLTQTERYLTPKEIQVNLEICKADYVSDWDAISMGMSAHDDLPKSFADFLMAHVVEKVAEEIEVSIWQGDTGVGGEFDGFVKLAEADVDVIDVTGTASSVTASNVIVEMRKATDLVPERLYGSEGLRLYVSNNVSRAYIQALGGFGANGLGANGIDGKGTTWRTDGSLSFDGVQIFVAQGLPSNTMFVAEKDNMFFGCGLTSDQNEVKVLDMADIDGSKNVRLIMRMTGCVNYGIGSEIVYYKPNVA